LLVDAKGTSLVKLPLSERRTALETFAAEEVPPELPIKLSPATTSMATVKRWFRSIGGELAGIVAKNLQLPYRSGTRDGMQKMKSMRTAECVVGGFRYASKGKLVGSLLLRLYDRGGLLHHRGLPVHIPH